MNDKKLNFVEVDAERLNSSFSNGFRDGAVFAFAAITAGATIVALT